MDRRNFLALAGGLPGLLWAGCGRRRAARSTRALSVSAGPHPAMSGLFLAQENGYFSAAGLEVQIQGIPTSLQAIPLLAGGKLDVCFLAVNASLINAVARGARLRIIAGREIASPTCGDMGTLYGRRRAFSGGLSDVRQLKGKRVAIHHKATIPEFILDSLLAGAGMSAEDVRVVVLRHPEALAALVGEKIDAMVSGTFADRDLAFVSPQLVRGPGLAQILPNFQYSHVVFGENLLQGDPDTGARFLSAYLRGAREFLEGRTPRFLEEYARSNNMDPRRLREACRDTFTPDGRIDLESLQRFADWAVKKKYCPQPVRAAQLTDSRFLDRLNSGNDPARSGERSDGES